MDDLKPKIIGIYKELNIIANDIKHKLGSEERDGDGETVTIDPDPNVTETITCTDCVCSHAEINFKEKAASFQVKFILPKTLPESKVKE